MNDGGGVGAPADSLSAFGRHQFVGRSYGRPSQPSDDGGAARRTCPGAAAVPAVRLVDVQRPALSLRLLQSTTAGPVLDIAFDGGLRRLRLPLQLAGR